MKFEDKVKIYHKIFKFCFTISLVAFLTLYLSQATGYYEYEQHKTMAFTSEQIKQFEKDVAEGKNIDMKKYLENSNKDYSNRMSDLGYELSSGVGNIVKSGIEGIFGALNKMVEE
mgnify:FL=1